MSDTKTITFSCGHEGDVHLNVNKKETEKLEAYFAEKGLCWECRKQADHEIVTDLGLPDLEGTEKQVAWGGDIRAQVVGNLTRKLGGINEMRVALTTPPVGLEKLMAALAIKTAKEWIENKDKLNKIVKGVESLKSADAEAGEKMVL